MRKPTPRPWRAIEAGSKVKAGAMTDVAYLSRHLKSEEERKANADLIIAACNAAQEINPDNPAAAAEAMPEMFRLLCEVASASQRICGKPFDSEKWLSEVETVVLKAKSKE